ncbi:Pro-Pol polyprotein [Merluccius polli]|uniref:Gypsy retrotransposon integrase-like protein 1 n=1 Tax=Merluccius polli TaxID=89951 RepID=A0AA47MPM3_MERPO|nr:Pro-Pol polyprotein [Merluccius polli]
MDVDTFIESPTEALLDSCTKEALLQIAGYYKVAISDADRKLKDRVKDALKSALMDKGILVGEVTLKLTPDAPLDTEGLTFEQRKELIMLQYEQDRIMQRDRLNHQAELDHERGKREANQGKRDSEGASETAADLRLVPKFNTDDPDTFFSLFERLAEARQWSPGRRCLLLQCVLTGRAQEAYASLSKEDSTNYSAVKNAVLQAYEMVPEAYRQRFRAGNKGADQTHLEFARDLRKHFSRWCSASGVDTLDDLTNLMLVEQFKLSVPGRVATYISEHKAKTPEQAASLADDFTLTHKSSFRSFSSAPMMNSEQGAYKTFARSSMTTPKTDSGLVCNYCRNTGHWKVDCPALNRSPQRSRYTYTKPNALATPVQIGRTTEQRVICGNDLAKDCLLSYLPFITDGCVSLPGHDSVPVKILRDTGAVDSFILQSVLPFSSQSYTGDNVLIRGIGLNTVSVPLHSVGIGSDFVQGTVVLGVRPALPVDGVHIELGNDIAGQRVWGDTPAPVVSVTPGDVNVDNEWGNPVCVVTRSMHSSGAVASPAGDQKGSSGLVSCVPDLSGLPFPCSAKELRDEQANDPGLVELFKNVLSSTDALSAACGYFMDNGVLFRKWVPHWDEFVGEAIVQVVAPTKYRDSIMKVAHDQCGHGGVRKTYDRVLRHFFWPRVKKDVSAYLKTCHTCQITGKPNQTIKPVPLHPIPAIGEPFEHIVIDCVGPLPRSKRETVAEIVSPNDGILRGRLKNSECVAQLDNMFMYIPETQRTELIQLIRKYPGLFGDTPSKTTWIEHDIDVAQSAPVKQRFYRVSPDKPTLPLSGRATSERCSGKREEAGLRAQIYTVKQAAALRTALAATRLPPQTWEPLFCKLAIHGHTPADCTSSPLPWEFRGALPHTKSHSRAAVGAGDKPSQVTLKSLSVPTEVKRTKPGWLSVTWLLIHSLYGDTLAYTVGKLGSAHPTLKLTTPIRIHWLPCLLTKAGDPADGASVDHAALCSQADGHDVVGELDWRGETEKADVVVISGGVVLRVNDDLRDVQGHLVGVAVLLALMAQDDGVAFHVQKIDMCYLGKKQWAAVSTKLLLMRDPPQKWPPSLVRLACQGQLPRGASSPPTILVFKGAGDPADGASVDRAALCSQADGHDVVGELDRRGETKKADVVVTTEGVVLGVNDDLRDVAGHLVGVAVLLALTAQDDGIAFHVQKIDMCYLGKKQWAAVSTKLFVMRDPPQKWPPSLVRLACQGQLPRGASSPPTILVFKGEIIERGKPARVCEKEKELNLLFEQ